MEPSSGWRLGEAAAAPARRCAHSREHAGPAAARRQQRLRRLRRLRPLHFASPRQTAAAHPLAPSCHLPCSFLPLLRPHRIPYQLHLFAERTECPDERVRELIVQ
jgi:hypothetical protein